MQSCACRSRQTLAERINAIIAKYETCPCPKASQQTRKASVPKIFSSPCLRRQSCNPCNLPCSPCPPSLPCPAIASPPCYPRSTISTQPSPGPGLSTYVSRRNLCPALRGCLSLYKRSSAACGPSTSQPSSCCRSSCPPIPRCTPLLSCPRSKPSCTIVRPSFRPLTSPKSQGPAPSTLDSYCAKCMPCVKCPRCSPCHRSTSTLGCRCSEDSGVTHEPISQQCSRPSCTPCNACCYACDSETVRPRCTTPCCRSCSGSSEMSSSTPGTCCASGSSHTTRRRLTVFDDPPYTSNLSERDFSSRFIRLDPCCCETDSSSSLENGNFGNKYR